MHISGETFPEYEFVGQKTETYKETKSWEKGMKGNIPHLDVKGAVN